MLFHPGFPRLKPWRDALGHFGLDHRPLIRDLTRTDKYHLRLDPDDGCYAQPLPLRRLYRLERGADDEPVSMEPVRGHQLDPGQHLPAGPGPPSRPRGRASAPVRPGGRQHQVFRLQRHWRLDRLAETFERPGSSSGRTPANGWGSRTARWRRSAPGWAVTQPLPLARIGLLREQRGNDLEDFVLSRRAGTSGVEILFAYTAGNTWRIVVPCFTGPSA